MFGSLFGAQTPKTVDSVLAVFNQSIEDLAIVQRQQREESERKQEEALRLQREALRAEQEADRAASVADRLKSLLNPAPADPSVAPQ